MKNLFYDGLLEVSTLHTRSKQGIDQSIFEQEIDFT